jgi:hypothetical protein
MPPKFAGKRQIAFCKDNQSKSDGAGSLFISVLTGSEKPQRVKNQPSGQMLKQLNWL